MHALCSWHQLLDDRVCGVLAVCSWHVLHGGVHGVPNMPCWHLLHSGVRSVHTVCSGAVRQHDWPWQLHPVPCRLVLANDVPDELHGASAALLTMGVERLLSVCSCERVRRRVFGPLTAARFGVAQACPNGQSSTGNASSCSPCAVGTYSMPSNGTYACTLCPDGQSSGSGASNCSACTVGTYSSPSTGVFACTLCPDGSTSTLPTGSSTCQSCGDGYYGAPSLGLFTCALCPGGQYATGSGQAACTMCTGMRQRGVGRFSLPWLW